MLVNSKMLAGTGLESICEIADEPALMKQKITLLFNTEFDRSQLLAREEILRKRFSDDVNAQKLIEEIWGK
jgi:hypothetical protein